MPRRKPEGETDALIPSSTPGKGDTKKDKGGKGAYLTFNNRRPDTFKVCF